MTNTPEVRFGICSHMGDEAINPLHEWEGLVASKRCHDTSCLRLMIIRRRTKGGGLTWMRYYHSETGRALLAPATTHEGRRCRWLEPCRTVPSVQGHTVAPLQASCRLALPGGGLIHTAQ